MDAAFKLLAANSDQAAVRTALETVYLYVKNYLDHPFEEKYRRIPITNKALQGKVCSLSGGYELIRAIGFQEVDDGVALQLISPVLAEMKDIADRIRIAGQYGISNHGFPPVCSLVSWETEGCFHT